ncbi:MAG: ATP-dependent Clp protease proteolytic subunit [Chloroflexota bacterium]|nr:ATP-dependent Clp protease proteolytic subunit [Chloroflexota bacterium]
MLRLRRALVSVAALVGTIALVAPTAAAGDHVALLRMTGTIDQVNATYITEGLKAAAGDGAAAAIIEVNSPGGELTSMDTMIQAIAASPIPVITWVYPEAGGAGSAATFVTLAGDVAAMAPSSTIGAAAVVGSNGEDLPTTEAQKVTNFYAAKIRELAAAHDRNADWAESAVRSAASVGAADAVAMRPPVVDILAGTSSELLAAVDLGKRADGYVYQHDGNPIPKLSGLPVTDVNMNIGQQLLHLLSDPNLALILFTIGFYGILAELFHPNYVSGSLGAIAIVLAFIGSNSLPLNLGGLILIIIAIGLFVLDLHLPSHGLLTLGGVVCFVLGASALWTGVTPGQEAINVQVSPILIGAIVVLTLIYFYGVVRALMRMRRQVALPIPIKALVGASGVAQTLIAPTGIAYAAGETWSARSEGEEIAAGTPVRVKEVKGLELLVEPTGAAGPPTTEGDANRG